MTRTVNARIAGFTFLYYIGLGVAVMFLMGRASQGTGIAARLANIAHHTADVRIAVVLSMLTGFAALVLGVTMWALTRDEDPDLAMLALTCRFGEGVLGTMPVTTLGLLWLATTLGGANPPDTASAHALGALLVKVGGWKTNVGALLFSVASALTSWLLLRGRMVPTPLAWLGVLSFEIPLALWLLFKGVRVPAQAVR